MSTPAEARAFLRRYGLTQSWEEHLRTAGATLGGEDYGVPWGTPLPPVAGVPVFVTPASPKWPAWYNTGLGNAGAYRRDDGTWTIYGHCSSQRSDGVFLSGNSGTVRPRPTAAAPHNGSHVHVHDIASDGRTRLRPFSTIADGSGSGGGGIVTPNLRSKNVSIVVARLEKTALYLWNLDTNVSVEIRNQNGTDAPQLTAMFPVVDFANSIEWQSLRDRFGNALATIDEQQQLAADIRAAIAGIQPGGQVDTAALSKALGTILAPLLDDEEKVKAAIAAATSQVLASVAAVPAARPVEYVLVPKA